MFKRSMFWLIFLLPLILVPAGMVQGDAPDDSGWLMSAGNADRSGFVDVELPSKLAPRWVYAARVAPKPAWPRLDKMPFDRAFHPVAAEGKVFFASSGDGGVYALDVATGKQQWSFFTEGPVRFAPAIWQDRMFVGSDDGYLYCLRLADGELLWKKRGGPSDQMVLGNERMISRWPVRGGPVVRSDIVYFAAGIFPTDGVFLYALDAKTGEDVWVNRDSGNIYMAQPHGGAFAESGVSAQGYLVATEEKLVVPTGRGVPAVFDRATGKFKYYYLQKAGWRGGATTMIAGSICYNNGHVIDLATGKILTNIGGGALARSNEGLVHATGKGTIFCKWVEAQNVNDKGETITTRKLDAYKHNKDVKLTTSAIVAGNTVVIGGKDSVVGMSLQSGETLWQLHVDGEAYALAAADGKLLIGTDAGEIYCFGEMDSSSVARDDAPSEQVESIAIADATQRAAEAIVAKSGIVEGYAIDLGAGEGDLAIALAQESMLHIIAVEPDPRKAAMARQRAISAGLYGDRIVVHNKPIDQTPYPKHFANLVVSGRSVSQGVTSVNHDEAKRLQRPYGGALALGPADRVSMNIRGELEGAGEWTHQYANPANTAATRDEVKGPLAPHWFRDVNQSIVQRHGRGPSPLYREGRIFSLGIDALVCVDAYNGRVLWEHPMPNILRAYHGDELMGVSGTGSPYCVGEHGIYVRRDSYVMRIDPRTGLEVARFHAPKIDDEETRWGFIATSGDLLFGSVADTDHIVAYRYVASSGDMSKQWTESKLFFVMDAKSGEVIWQYKPKHSIRHNAIAIGGGIVHLIDRPLAEFDRDRKGNGEQALGKLIAFNAKTGEQMWQQEQVWGTVLIHGVEHQTLLMSYQPTRFRLASEKGGKLAAFDSCSGKKLWQHDNANYKSRPVLIDRTIYTQGGAWDLIDGSGKDFKLGDRSYGCGILSAGRNLIAYRSATLGYCDLTEGDKVRNFGGLRVGCWINSLPAGGMLLIPDGSAGCRCAYQNQTWIALQTDPTKGE